MSISGWAENWGPLITLGSTVALLGTTFWYAVITRNMARSAKDSALASQASAEATERAAIASEAAVAAAREAAGLAHAQVDVSFHVRRVSLAGEHPARLALVIECTGGTLYVHGLTITRGYLRPATGEGAMGEAKLYYDETALQPHRPVPHLLHRGETLVFLGPNEELPHSVDRLIMAIAYSFLPDGQVSRRQVIYDES